MEKEPIFTIQAKALPDNTDFEASDLSLFHVECGGGPINIDTRMPRKWELKCTQCSVSKDVKINHDGTSAIFRTAVDGRSRKIFDGNYEVYLVVEQAN